MKLSAVSFEETEEPLLAKVVEYYRDQGTLGRMQKFGLLGEGALEAVFLDPKSTEDERQQALALTQLWISSKLRLMAIYCPSAVSGMLKTISTPAIEPQATLTTAIAPNQQPMGAGF